MARYPILFGGLRPPNPLTRSLAGAPSPAPFAWAHSLRSFATPLQRECPTQTRCALARGGPKAPLRSRGLTRCARSLFPAERVSNPPVAPSLAGAPSPAPFAWAHSLRSFATPLQREWPTQTRCALARGGPKAPLRSRGLTRCARSLLPCRESGQPRPLTQSLASFDGAQDAPSLVEGRGPLRIPAPLLWAARFARRFGLPHTKLLVHGGVVRLVAETRPDSLPGWPARPRSRTSLGSNWRCSGPPT